VVLWQMTDKETFEEVGPEGFATQPIGTGPFKFVEWVRGERIVFEANDDYWLGRPKVDRVIFRPIPETATRLTALEANQVQIVAEVPPEYELFTPPGVKILEVSGTRVWYIGLNVNMKPFDDKRVRQAMNYAVDVDTIIQGLLFGKATKTDNPLFPRVFGYKSTPVYSYNPQKARQLLAEAGYPNGFEVTLDTQPPFKELAEALAAQYAEVGIRVNVNIMEVNALYDKYEPGNSQMFLTSWGNSELDADATLARNFWSGRVDAYTNYSNPEVDRLIELGAITLDQEERLKYYHEALDLIVEDAPWVFLYTASEVYAVRDSVKNWRPRSDALVNLLETTIE